MVSSSLVALGGAVVTALLMVLFRVEDARQRRFFEPVRRWFDRIVTVLQRGFTHSVVAVERGRVRLIIHYVVHLCLASVRRIANTVAQTMGHLERRNRRSVRTLLQETTSDPSSHLSLIKQHQKETELSEAEKHELKERFIEGK